MSNNAGWNLATVLLLILISIGIVACQVTPPDDWPLKRDPQEVRP
jgi:hypothetical protein